MKKIIWLPPVIGVAFGLLAGIAMISGLSFLLSSTEASNVIGFFMVLFLLSAALGGPLAGAITSTICVLFVAMFGAPDMKAVSSDPVVLWTNVVVMGTLVALIGFAYRLIFEHVKMPARLLPWAGLVIAFYLLSSPINIGIQFTLKGEAGILSAVLGSYKDYIPQAIFDIFFTSLVFTALPARYRRPLWYESKKAPEHNG
jgi:nitrate/nitrite transporter NarK